ncbi:hypothetical protein AHiyo1_30850 [Arthrobacter sp. Hiyo1]|nr:hypothetical protein AHiyo1_30850 [Arthrobacter sp. Hiyo1]
MREARYSPTTRVLAMAVTANRSMPHRPRKRSLIMDTARYAATVSA